MAKNKEKKKREREKAYGRGNLAGPKLITITKILQGVLGAHYLYLEPTTSDPWCQSAPPVHQGTTTTVTAWWHFGQMPSWCTRAPEVTKAQLHFGTYPQD